MGAAAAKKKAAAVAAAAAAGPLVVREVGDVSERGGRGLLPTSPRGAIHYLATLGNTQPYQAVITAASSEYDGHYAQHRVVHGKEYDKEGGGACATQHTKPGAWMSVDLLGNRQ